MVTSVDLDRSILALERYCASQGLAGPDPYDGLSSPLAGVATNKRARQVVIQGVKRVPRGVRRAIGIRPVRMAKALSLFARGYRRCPDLFDWRATGEPIVDELLATRSDGEGWGYEFDVQTRWAFYPAGSSNIIATSFVIEALAEAGALDRVPHEFWSWLERRMVAPEGFVRYVPTSDHLIHNANVLGARTLSRSPEPNHRETALAAIERTIQAQASDGSWPYGEGPNLGWIDSFHTVYVLDALRTLRQADPTVERAFTLGMSFWTDTFGRYTEPPYFADGSGPVDLHNLATSLLPHAWAAMPRDVTAAAVAAFLQYQDADGGFRRRRWEPSFMRWTNAHAFNALTLIRATS